MGGREELGLLFFLESVPAHLYGLFTGELTSVERFFYLVRSFFLSRKKVHKNRYSLASFPS